MSDKPQGPGWWLASDGTWHPPELHPSVRDDTSANPAPTAVPEAPVTATAAPAADSPQAPVATAAAPGPGTFAPASPSPSAVPADPTAHRRPQWSGESDRRPEAGPMYPDLFQQAVAGSRLADTITVNSLDGEHRESLDVPQSSPHDSQFLVSTSAAGPSEVGAFTGASARKRRRWGH